MPRGRVRLERWWRHTLSGGRTGRLWAGPIREGFTERSRIGRRFGSGYRVPPEGLYCAVQEPTRQRSASRALMPPPLRPVASASPA